MSNIYDVLQAGYDANPDADILIVSHEQWNEYYESVKPEIKADYKLRGFFKVYARKQPMHRYSTLIKYIHALAYRGKPVVVDTEYDALMRGHQTRRVVQRI